MYKDCVFQNLMDAGCGQDEIEEFFQLKGENKTQEMLRLLSKHRQNLLDALHSIQKQIDVLDYLIFNIKQNLN